MSEKMQVVILGADLNCYHLARAFHEAYGISCYAFGRYAISATKYSRFVRFTAVPELEDESVAIPLLQGFARSHPAEKRYLLSCTDHYAQMIIEHKKDLPDYVCPAPEEKIFSLLQKKAAFYEICDKYGILYPETRVLPANAPTDEIVSSARPLGYPLILKPSSSVIYWENPFPGMKKVYLCTDEEETVSVFKEIAVSGYNDKIVLQKYIPGGDDRMRVLTTFSDERGKVRAMALGHTLLEEHTPKGLGNHAAILTENADDLPQLGLVRQMLEDLRYTGFANFDIKYDERDGQYRFFEINLRQGRSNYYLTGSGISVARLIAETYADPGDSLELSREGHFWRFIPKSVVYSYTEDEKLVQKAKELARSGNASSSLLYGKDLCLNPLRALCVLVMMQRQKKKYATYCMKIR
ncbi:MAG: ATP-grasp domain-containing protein [Clostridia bacterium]|nr:ATP-grasp domain-containing protein [Clostridia bacterium]